MSKKIEEHNMKVLSRVEVEDASDTNVRISVDNFTEVEGILGAINELQIKYPYTKFSIEVDMR